MSKTKHSSGRWLLIKAGAGSIVIAEDATPVPGLRFPKTVARTDWCRGEEDDANAHLITAAPELLELLKQAIRFFGVDDPDDNSWQQEAILAIAKAEGRS